MPVRLQNITLLPTFGAPTSAIFFRGDSCRGGPSECAGRLRPDAKAAQILRSILPLFLSFTLCLCRLQELKQLLEYLWLDGVLDVTGVPLGGLRIE